MKIEKIVLGLFLIFLIQGCTKDEIDDVNQQAVSYESFDHFYKNATSLKVEIAYEPNAAPYVNTGFGASANFDFTANNLNALFAPRTDPVTIIVDKTLSEMTLMPAQNKSSFSLSDIVAISKNYQIEQSSENQGVIFVAFLDGYYESDGQANTGVLGVSIGSFTVAIFKPVIESIQGGGGLGSNPKYQVEQATVVHEIAHSLGLVNAGVAMQSAHQDEAHGKHCTNPDCVMYWENEAAGAMSGIFGTASVNQIVFGQECIDDISNFLN